ncbi:endonuclease/exonuclease/phosphatase family protein [Pseudomonas sp. ZM23]|uniref:Endonuclease/exonuclease/phosphatase family protein n=1 Tax=Pseudomonas triclosanedens TaxID=2961893 RepID=A0ABY7A079_9PSED|nr:endonuclease/exonuclease/phosphatase family protein [Pseudomonas triclosanedens]MCP8464047.1 endonuclease/exonuclease/phosphatase family protein [Pseudomonas triclosanedens]MCP8469131.1 endonuclease/exonuclease/phosphatase family protein [Pseudomonas triclosanedens]MCP8475853.1 endonuclease/exonuclease/phosphatase family protein [Pseudomonas triclosanedens]WAI50444.1 endonuclease/exonuclease/phosphatase family protein [Pseudomonas triclosanedens]
MNLSQPRRILFILLIVLLLAATAAAWLLAWHPAGREAVAAQCRAPAALLQPGQALKVMTWNVQYLAGKRYIFWDDLPDTTGPDDKPSAEDLAYTLDEVVRVIRDETPDIVLLQEVDDGAAATGEQDQQALIGARLADLYPCSTAAFDWKARFDPNPHVFGSAGRKLVTFSRFQITSGERLALPQRASIPLLRLFAPQPALLQSELPIRGGGKLTVINTRLERPNGDDTPQRQVDALELHLSSLQRAGQPWLLGGDLGLLPLGQYPYLPEVLRAPYRANSELNLLAARFPMIPAVQESSGAEQENWYTHFPNDPRVHKPDRTLDYLIYSPRLSRIEAGVRSNDTLRISNHLPLTGRFLLPH